MRFFASGLFLLAHGLLVLEHIALGTALHGVAEVFLAPWALRHRAWDLIVIGLIFCVFDLWGYGSMYYCICLSFLPYLRVLGHLAELEISDRLLLRKRGRRRWLVLRISVVFPA